MPRDVVHFFEDETEKKIHFEIYPPLFLTEVQKCFSGFYKNFQYVRASYIFYDNKKNCAYYDAHMSQKITLNH